MATINLLPTALTLKSKDKAVIDAIKKFVLLGFIVLIVASLIIAGYLIYLSLGMRASLGREEVFKQEISSFQETEQGLFLIKDRISKIKTVYAKESANKQIEVLADFLKNTPGDFRILEIQVTSQKVNLSLIFPTSSAFGAFYKSMVDSKVYTGVVLKAFSFNPSAGYVAAFELSQQ